MTTLTAFYRDAAPECLPCLVTDYIRNPVPWALNAVGMPCPASREREMITMSALASTTTSSPSSASSSGTLPDHRRQWVGSW